MSSPKEILLEYLKREAEETDILNALVEICEHDPNVAYAFDCISDIEFVEVVHEVSAHMLEHIKKTEESVSI